MKTFATEEEWIDFFISKEAFWRHEGNPRRPHALLSKGDHSDGFFNWNEISQRPQDLKRVAHDLGILIKNDQPLYFNLTSVDRIVGPGSGAITLADRLAEEIGSLAHTYCYSGFTEKQPDGSMLYRGQLEPEELVVVVEDTITTGLSTQKTITAIETAGGVVAPFIGAVCNRSGLTTIGDRRIIALVTVAMNNWNPESCELCRQGSEAIRPKVGNNWSRLSASYPQN